MTDISKIDMNRIEGLIEKLESMIYVVETSSNGNGWYRVWSDGWIEQGGIINGATDKNSTHNLLKTYKNTQYNIFVTSNSSNNTFNAAQPDWINVKTTTTFTLHCDSFGGDISWYACGY